MLKVDWVHSKRVPAYVCPNRYLQTRGLEPQGEPPWSAGGAESRSKMRSDRKIPVTTASEQQTI